MVKDWFADVPWKRTKTIGIVGLGKLGFPIAVGNALCGHKVLGYDVNPDRMTANPEAHTYLEAGIGGRGRFQDYLSKDLGMEFVQLVELVDRSELIFVIVQTPHDPEYEGITRVPFTPKDFDYTYLRSALSAVGEALEWNFADHPIQRKTIVVVSTVLPGTLDRIMPGNFRVLVDDRNTPVDLVYNPSFIAMGTSLRDFFLPEFVLIGHNGKKWGRAYLEKYYDELVWLRDEEESQEILLVRGQRPMLMPVAAMSIPSAELTKVAYNTFISMKLGFVNVLQEICHKIPGADVDHVTNALCRAHRRLISGAYMKAGMGDGGACHPRDNIAMSWLADKLKLNFDFFEAVMASREGHADWMAGMVYQHSCYGKLPRAIYGYAFKPDTNIVTGSHALLVNKIISDMGIAASVVFDDAIDPLETIEPLKKEPHVVFLGKFSRHWLTAGLAAGTIVIDPWRSLGRDEEPPAGIIYVPLGVGI